MDKPAKITKLVSFTVEIDMQINIESDLDEETLIKELISDKIDLSSAVELTRRIATFRVEDVNHYYS